MCLIIKFECGKQLKISKVTYQFHWQEAYYGKHN